MPNRSQTADTSYAFTCAQMEWAIACLNGSGFSGPTFSVILSLEMQRGVCAQS